MSFKIWENNHIPMNFDIYIFNWTNPEEINDPTRKPNLVQLGPYSFKLVNYFRDIAKLYLASKLLIVNIIIFQAGDGKNQRYIP